MNENEVQIFEFENHGIEVVYLNGEPLFNPYHVGKCLDLKNSSVERYLRKMDDLERVDLKSINMNESINLKFMQDYTRYLLREPGLYQLILKSRKSEAANFTKWITHDVLPQIRKTGTYKIPQHDQVILSNIIENTEKLLGFKKREIAVSQNESWNMKLSRVITDCARNKMGSTKDLYNELVYLFAAETGFNINEIAEQQGMSRRDYLLKNQTICKTLYEFACDFFHAENRQIRLIPFIKEHKDQTCLL